MRSYHVVGVQMAHPSAFARLPLNQPAESIGGLYKELVKENLGHVRAFLCEAGVLGRRHAGGLSRRVFVDRQDRR